MYVDTNSKGNQSWNKNKEINFHLLLILMLKNPVFYVELNPLLTILMFLSFIIVTGFMNIFRSSCSQVFTGIQVWILQYSELKRDFSTLVQVFPVSIAKFLRTTFLQNSFSGCFCIFLKVIKQPFRKGVNIMTSQ